MLKSSLRSTILVGLGLVFLLGPAPIGAPHALAVENSVQVPVWAYYYIWFNASSWNRAKTDYPALGRYSSDESAVMRQHIEWAKAAGIQGFLVSWKRTPLLDRRLSPTRPDRGSSGLPPRDRLRRAGFLPSPAHLKKIRSDLRYFTTRYGHDPAFSAFGQPVIVWSGTWEFSPREVESVTRPFAGRLQILGSERSPEDYGRIARFVDGDAYYWSSVNPDTYTGYPEKLAAMSGAVHATGGMWIAPAAPGFDARLVGGTTVVSRRDGDTLRREFQAALGSDPDVIGLISWNEFSENSQVEPSVNYGSSYLSELADLLSVRAPSIPNFDSSAPSGRGSALPAVGALGLLGALMVGSVAAIAVRRHGRRAER